jgi:AcrR family transcriptional regulator
MNALPSVKSQDRTRRQRDRILEAAQQCFIEHGFHAASMASIATTANMSAGLIYRYFDSKSAIVQAIIARQLEDNRANIASLRSDPDLGRRILDLFARWRTRDPSVTNAALLLEMSAQATRDPQVAAALVQADRITGAEFIAWLRERAQQAGKHPDDRDLRARALALKAFIEGLAVRAVREPDFDASVAQAAVELLLPLLTFD